MGSGISNDERIARFLETEDISLLAEPIFLKKADKCPKGLHTKQVTLYLEHVQLD